MLRYFYHPIHPCFYSLSGIWDVQKVITLGAAIETYTALSAMKILLAGLSYRHLEWKTQQTHHPHYRLAKLALDHPELDQI